MAKGSRSDDDRSISPLSPLIWENSNINTANNIEVRCPNTSDNTSLCLTKQHQTSRQNNNSHTQYKTQPSTSSIRHYYPSISTESAKALRNPTSNTVNNGNNPYCKGHTITNTTPQKDSRNRNIKALLPNNMPNQNLIRAVSTTSTRRAPNPDSTDIVNNTLSRKNAQRDNNPQDNNQAVGDPFQHTKRTNTIRLYFQNINGISTNQWEDLRHSSLQLQKFNIDIVGFAETNISLNHTNRSYAQAQIRRFTKQAHISTSCSLDTGPTDYQPGGVCTGVLGKCTGRIVETFTDPSGLGRWAGHLLIGSGTSSIAVITAYRPIRSQGIGTTYQQQWRLLRHAEKENPEPRAQLLHDLAATIKNWTNKKYEVILMWDANESLDNPK
jgi:hypothetical protein